MFTGLVQAVGKVERLERSPHGARLLVDPVEWPHRPEVGQSISISGCCLTIVAIDNGRWAFDVVPETLDKTTIGALAKGSLVNLEHAVTPTTLLGGHLVQGHVDGVGHVERLQKDAEGWRVLIGAPDAVCPYLVPKGSICVDGVSLTIAGLAETSFEVALIPATLQSTTLVDLEAGAAVNLEADLIAKTVVHTLGRIHSAGPG